MKPPRNRKIRSAAKLAEAFFSGIRFESGSTTRGSNAVTGSGIASVIHHAAIHSARPQTRHAGSLIPSGGATKNVSRKSATPSTSPICRTSAGVWSAGASGMGGLAGPAGRGQGRT